MDKPVRPGKHLALFLAEADGLLSQLEGGLVDLEKEATPELLHRLFRAVHTIKDGAGLMGLSDIADVAHGMESVLDGLRKQRIPLTTGTTSGLLAGLDIAQSMAQALREGEQPDIPVREIVEHLHAIASDAVTQKRAADLAHSPEGAKPATDVAGAPANLPSAQKASKEPETLSFVTFVVADEIYALPIDVVDRVLRGQAAVQVPGVPDYIEGITNLRGNVLPLVNLRTLLGLPASAFDSNGEIVVVQHRGEHVGLLIDAVRGVRRIFTAEIDPPSAVISSTHTDFIQGIGRTADGMAIVLDLEALLGKRDQAAL